MARIKLVLAERAKEEANEAKRKTMHDMLNAR